jgi:hypothetical protein
MRSRMTLFSIVIVTLVLVYVAGYVALRRSARLMIYSSAEGEPFFLVHTTPAAIGFIYRPLMLVEWRLSH